MKQELSGLVRQALQAPYSDEYRQCDSDLCAKVMQLKLGLLRGCSIVQSGGWLARRLSTDLPNPARPYNGCCGQLSEWSQILSRDHLPWILSL